MLLMFTKFTSDHRYAALMARRLLAGSTLSLAILLPLPLGSHAQPYIDPGTGSIVIQTVIGAVAAVAVAMAMFWKQIKHFVSGLFTRSKKSEEPEKR